MWTTMVMNPLYFSSVADLLSLCRPLGRTFYWSDLCDRLPSGYSFFSLPCSKYTMLECFKEGGFDYFMPPYPFLPPSPYPAKPSIANKTVAELGVILSPSCTNWAGIPVPGRCSFLVIHAQCLFSPRNPELLMYLVDAACLRELSVWRHNS